ncbi:hypothetical protein BACT_1092 [Bifidobacterium actinocoloniiforme DSM 22766]|uniref:Uncharacterized protein n=1 Tax=Bifidobacterium actinocoloniiforme DSM 22766 TaxID=1437605 RepID=A0A086Z1J0_9BIFI|nr:hypothetical protein [Bifidobacterium actinocoloniiforme]AKV55528.1 hypothetical protein AB656_04075 [Bifidobacterium actinocoloniiforme DSM 22766]KFI40390.1 hypothetical protein BACT_1092 [Bifidobacterium actinocoloniiforme DSM 22766]
MSLSIADSTLVLAKIRAHHGNAAITDLEARTFHEELIPDATMRDAMEAVRRYYANNQTGRWMGSGDVNAGIKAVRKARIPEDAQIGRLMDQAGIDSDHYTAYRRRLIKGVQHGLSVGQAHERAAQEAKRLRIEPAQPKPRRKPTGHFIGRRVGDMDINRIIGQGKEE